MLRKSVRSTGIAFLLLLLGTHASQAQDFSAYKKRLLIRQGDTLRYRILYPANYNREKSYPLVVFLHGAGERGNDNEQQVTWVAGIFLRDSMRKKYPAIIVFPQCPADSFWCRFTIRMDTAKAAVWNRSLNTSGLSTPERLVKILLDSLAENKISDRSRIYIGGLSLGGFGTYDLLVHYPHYFAAAFSISGQANVKLYSERASNVPIWIFHGAADNVIDPQPDRDLIKALQNVGAKNARYSEYPGVAHNAWDKAFEEPGLIPWLFSFRK